MTLDVRNYRNLVNLMVEYSQDYFDDYDDEEIAFSAFVRGGSAARIAGALSELNTVDSSCSSEATLEAQLTRAGLAIIMTGGSSPYRDFVERLRDRLTAALEGATQSSGLARPPAPNVSRLT